MLLDPTTDLILTNANIAYGKSGQETAHSTSTNTAQANFLDLAPEIRKIIYHYAFAQQNGKILGLSREPLVDYGSGPPSSFWIQDSLQRGLAYNTRAPKNEPSNVALLQTCHLIHREATGIFYSKNQIILYDEDNIEIFFWLLDIGSFDRSAIRDLSIDWAYGVEVSAGMLHVRSLLKEIISLQGSESAEVERQRVQLIGAVRCLELKQVKLIVRTLNLLVSSQKLESLAVTLPGVDAGDMFDIENDNVFFAEELFSNSTRNVHACVPALLEKFVGLRKLTIGYTKDLDLAQKVANSVGAEELVVQLAPECRWYGVDDLDRAAWMSKGWIIEDREARKHFAKVFESTEVSREQHRSAFRLKNVETSKEQSRKEHRIDGYEDSTNHSFRADMPIINRELPKN